MDTYSLCSQHQIGERLAVHRADSVWIEGLDFFHLVFFGFWAKIETFFEAIFRLRKKPRPLYARFSYRTAVFRAPFPILTTEKSGLSIQTEFVLHTFLSLKVRWIARVRAVRVTLGGSTLPNSTSVYSSPVRSAQPKPWPLGFPDRAPWIRIRHIRVSFRTKTHMLTRERTRDPQAY